MNCRKLAKTEHKWHVSDSCFLIVHIDAAFNEVVHFETESLFGGFDANLPQRTF